MPDGRTQIAIYDETRTLLESLVGRLAAEQQRPVTLIEAMHVAVRETERRHREGDS